MGPAVSAANGIPGMGLGMGIAMGLAARATHMVPAAGFTPHILGVGVEQPMLGQQYAVPAAEVALQMSSPHNVGPGVHEWLMQHRRG
jgi:hypothetical protein